MLPLADWWLMSVKLFGSQTSPYVRKVRITLLEKGLDCEFIIESPADPQSQVARLNPLGKVPLLQLDDGQVLFDSPMIVEYLDSFIGSSLLDYEGMRWQIQRWHALGDGINDAVVARMLEGRREEAKQDIAFVRKQEGKVAAALQFADDHYHGGTYLIDNNLTMADIALAVALDYTDFRYVHNWRTQHPRLAQWLANISQRPSFKETKPAA